MVSIDRKKLGKYVRTRGNNYELRILKELEALGYLDISTSRNESKRADNRGIDLIIPGSILKPQCKIQQSTPNIEKLFNETEANILFWKKVRKISTNNISSGEFVILPKELFYELMKLNSLK